MYRKGVKTLPRCFKKELVKLYPVAFSSIDAVKPLVGPDFTIQEENRIVELLTRIHCLPSFWLVTSTHPAYKRSFWVIFEKKLTKKVEASLFLLISHSEFYSLSIISVSEYYGIY